MLLGTLYWQLMSNNQTNSKQVPLLASRPRVYSGPGMAIPTLQGMFKTPSRVVRNRVVKYEPSSIISVSLRLMYECVHALAPRMCAVCTHWD